MLGKVFETAVIVSSVAVAYVFVTALTQLV